tara:strand:+ start:73 stop:966 length:894 start_codon:yes stop_codon:yes gene_type:complete
MLSLLTVAPLVSGYVTPLASPASLCRSAACAPHMSIYNPSWDMSGLRMSPDEPSPEVDPRRKSPGTPERRPFMPLPMVGMGDDKMDVLSRLLRDRILLLGQQVDDEVANLLVAQFLYLANDDGEKDITLYINSPGGSVSAGMAIFDTMQYVPCDINTVCFGTAASMGAFLLGAGEKGKRRSLPNSRIMIHQPLGGAQGQAADIEIQVTWTLISHLCPPLSHRPFSFFCACRHTRVFWFALSPASSGSFAGQGDPLHPRPPLRVHCRLHRAARRQDRGRLRSRLLYDAGGSQGLRDHR